MGNPCRWSLLSICPGELTPGHSPLFSERKIDLIDRRLEGVTRLLQEMKTTMPSPNAQLAVHDKDSPHDKTSQPSASSTSTPFGHAVQPASDSPVIEAESSLTAHSIFANEFLQNAVGTDSLQGASLEMRETLDSLHHIVDALKQQTPATEMIYTMANQTPRPALAGIKLPPIQKTVALVRRYKSRFTLPRQSPRISLVLILLITLD